MQRVERKHQGGAGRGKRSRRVGRWLIPAVLALLACAAVVLVFRIGDKPDTEIPEKEDHSGVLVNRAVEEIASVVITRRNGESWAAEREEDTLYPAGIRSWSVDPAVGDPLQDALAHLDYEEILTEHPADYADSLGDFGLDAPLVTAVCRFRDGEVLEVRIGDPVTGIEEGWYYMTVAGDDRLFAASGGTVQDLNVEEALLHPVNQPQILSALLDRITLQGSDGATTAEWALRGQITDADAGENWMITAPFAYPADGEAVSGLKENAENLRMGTFYGMATAENLAATGLQTPSAILTFHMAAGSTGTVSQESGVYDVQDWEERTVTLQLGAARDENVSWMRFGEEIYAVNRIAFSAFTDTDPLSTAARYPVATPYNSLSELTVEEAGETTVYQLEHGGEEETTVRKNGETIDAAAFEAAYERLMTVTVSGKLPEGAEIGETQKKYTFRTTSGGTHTLEFWSFDDLHQGLTQDGCTLFYLIRDGMTELP